MHGLTPEGSIFRFAQSSVVLSPAVTTASGYSRTGATRSQRAGATFEPKNGNWMFANLQSPGFTFTMTGPWRKGAN